MVVLNNTSVHLMFSGSENILYFFIFRGIIRAYFHFGMTKQISNAFSKSLSSYAENKMENKLIHELINIWMIYCSAITKKNIPKQDF